MRILLHTSSHVCTIFRPHYWHVGALVSADGLVYKQAEDAAHAAASAAATQSARKPVSVASGNDQFTPGGAEFNRRRVRRPLEYRPPVCAACPRPLPAFNSTVFCADACTLCKASMELAIPTPSTRPCFTIAASSATSKCDRGSRPFRSGSQWRFRRFVNQF